VALLFGPGTCGWRTGEDGTEAERRQAQAARAERRAAQRRQAEAEAGADTGLWCPYCRRGFCERRGRCVMCYLTGVISVGLGLTLLDPWRS
jgi:hypothetical protein